MIEIQNNQMKVRISCDKRKLSTAIHCQFVEDTETFSKFVYKNFALACLGEKVKLCCILRIFFDYPLYQNSPLIVNKTRKMMLFARNV